MINKLLCFSAVLLSAFVHSSTSALKVDSIDIESMPDSDQFVRDEIACLAKNIYFEAGTEEYIGKIAVGLVTKNRVSDSRWPNTYCDVVQQGPTLKTSKGTYVPVRHKCQFSWYCDGKGDVPYEGNSWRQSQRAAEIIYFTNMYDGLVSGSTHYHADYVEPNWSKFLDRVTKIDKHIFYR